MSSRTSSAEPAKLLRYSEVTLDLDQALQSRASQLRGILEHFERRCPEPEMRIGAAYVADDLRGYAIQCEPADAQVKDVGQRFIRADLTSLGIGAVAPSLPALASVSKVHLQSLLDIPRWLGQQISDTVALVEGSARWLREAKQHLQQKASDMVIGIRGQIGYAMSPIGIPEAISHLEGTDAGRDLVRSAKEAHVKFIISPNGGYIGDPNGSEILVTLGNSGSPKFRGVFSQDSDGDDKTLDPTIVISDWMHLRLWSKKAAAAGTLAHEMQHALDYATNQLSSAAAYESEGEETDGIPKGELIVDSTRKSIADAVENRVASEIRAWSRGEAVENNTTHIDDGKATYDEKLDILQRGYEAIYENDYSEALSKYGYEVDIALSSSGEILVELEAI